MICQRNGPGPSGGPGLLALVAVIGLVAAGGWAQEHQEAHESDPEVAQEAPAAGAQGESAQTFGGHHVHTEYRNGLGVFLGGTAETAEDRTFGTIGLEYERMLADRWAFQAVVEHVRDFDAWVFTAPVGFRLAGTLWAVAGPGLETEARRTGLEAEPQGDAQATAHDDSHSVEPQEQGSDGPFFLWRFGLIYGIHLGESGRFGLFPSLSLDMVREHGEWVEAWVFGVGISYHF
jgi:hypothetical protein